MVERGAWAAKGVAATDPSALRATVGRLVAPANAAADGIP